MKDDRRTIGDPQKHSSSEKGSNALEEVGCLSVVLQNRWELLMKWANKREIHPTMQKILGGER